MKINGTYHTRVRILLHMTLEDLENNEPLGKKIIESIPNASKPEWAASLISTVSKHIEFMPEEIEKLLALVEARELSKAKDQLNKINTFAEENPGYRPAALLMLAEGVAKVVYNATKPPDPFPEQSGWYVALSAKRTADKINDDGLDAEIMDIITSHLKS